MVPKPRVMLSPWSTSVSSCAVIAKVLLVSDVVKDTVPGTIEWSAAVAPLLETTVMGMSTAVAGELLRVKVTEASVPRSAAV